MDLTESQEVSTQGQAEARQPESARLLTQAIRSLLSEQHLPTRNDQLHALGYECMARGQSAEMLANAALRATANSGGDAGAVVAELLLGYAAARDEQRKRQWEEHLLRLVHELDGLHKVTSAANSTLDLDASLQAVVEIVAEVMNVEVCSIYVFDREDLTLTLRATYGLNSTAIGNVVVRIGEGITGLAGEIGKPVAVSDVLHEPRFRREPLLNEESYRSILCVPIILFTMPRVQVTTERLQGVISIQTQHPHTYSAEEISYLEVVAGELAFSIANAQVFQQTDERLHQKVRELTTLQRVTAALATTLNERSLLQMIAEQAVVLGRADRADIFEHEQSRSPRLVASWGEGSSVGLEPFIAKVLREKRPVVVLNAYIDERYPELAAMAYRERIHSVFCLPLRAGEEIRGALCLSTREARQFDYEQVQLLSTFADEAALAMQNARLYEQVQRSLTIKNMLLQEMHHRVRNNLQTISALLTMQARRLEAGSDARRALEDSGSRIQSIAAVHNLLCRDDITSTTVQAIARQVVDNVIGLVGDQQVRFEVTGVPVEIGAREATLLALVINELIGNALHHGITDQGGTIGVDAWLEDSHVLVQVRDNGPGPGKRGSTKQASGLGFQIIETLITADLAGSFAFRRTEGWSRALVRFPHHFPSQDG